MYNSILHHPVSLPGGKSLVVCDLIQGLLQKEPHRRIGAIADFVS